MDCLCRHTSSVRSCGKASLYFFSEKWCCEGSKFARCLLANLSGEEGGFVAGVARAVDYERKKQGVQLNAPIEVIWREMGEFLSMIHRRMASGLMGFARIILALLPCFSQSKERGIKWEYLLEKKRKYLVL